MIGRIRTFARLYYYNPWELCPPVFMISTFRIQLTGCYYYYYFFQKGVDQVGKVNFVTSACLILVASTDTAMEPLGSVSAKRIGAASSAIKVREKKDFLS